MAASIPWLSSAAMAQDEPDFSGRWTLVPEDSVIQRAEGPITVAVFGSDFTVQRDADAYSCESRQNLRSSGA